MKTWFKRTLIGLFGATLLVGGLVACGHRGYSHDGAHMSAEDSAKWRERFTERAGKELQLDEAQKQRVGLLFDKMREQRNALMGANGNPRAELSGLIASDKFDKTRAQSLVQEKTAAVREKSPEVITAMADFYDSLKPEQQQKLRDFLAKRQGRFGRHG